MKKLSLIRKRYLVGRSRQIQAAKFRPTVARFYQRRREAIKARKIRRASQRTMKAPVQFFVRSDSQRATLLEYLSHIDRALASGKLVHLDLSEVENFHPCGTLLFLSKLDIWSATYPGMLTGTYPANERSEELLQHVGALKLLGLPDRLSITHENVRFWHYHSGSLADASRYAELTRDLLTSIEHPEGVLFGDCLNEAVGNTVSHAYCFERDGLPPPSARKWWVLSEVKDGTVFVAIFDWGVTIPASLRRKPEWFDFLKLRRWKDARLIEAAAASERTSTRLPHRGKGLPEMVEFSKNLATGGLSITSGKGAYTYNADTDKFYRSRFKCPMPGTLVLWQIPFRKERKHDTENDLNS